MDHLNWTFDGAFEPLFYWGEENLNTLTFQKFKCPGIDIKASIAPIKKLVGKSTFYQNDHCDTQ